MSLSLQLKRATCYRLRVSSDCLRLITTHGGKSRKKNLVPNHESLYVKKTRASPRPHDTAPRRRCQPTSPGPRDDAPRPPPPALPCTSAPPAPTRRRPPHRGKPPTPVPNLPTTLRRRPATPPAALALHVGAASPKGPPRTQSRGPPTSVRRIWPQPHCGSTPTRPCPRRSPHLIWHPRQSLRPHWILPSPELAVTCSTTPPPAANDDFVLNLF